MSRRLSPPKAAARSGIAAFGHLSPSDQARARRAVGRFADWLDEEVDAAQSDARLRRLAAWRGVISVCQYLQQRFAGSDQDTGTAPVAKPKHLKFDADLGIALPHFPWDVLSAHVQEAERAIAALEPYEGEPFGRRLSVRGDKSTASKTPVSSVEQAHLATLERQGGELVALVRQFEAELIAVTPSPKRKKASAATPGKPLTPPQLAAQLGVSPDKILGWIRKGELKASNVATKAGGRPRYSIDPADVEAFRKQRMLEKPPERRRRKRKADDGVIEFF